MNILPQGSRICATPKSTPIFVTVNGKPVVVGKVLDGVFVKRIRGGKHLLHTPRAICLDSHNITDAKAAGATAIKITDIETGTTYETTIGHFQNYSFPVPRGYGYQLGLVLEQWSINGCLPEVERQAAIVSARKERIATQLSMFEVNQ